MHRISRVWLSWMFLALAPLVSHATHVDRLTVISYHEIEEPARALIPGYAVSPTMFVRHVDWLRNNGFVFVSVDQVLSAKNGGAPLPPKAVLLTFDDAYTSVYQHAWPLLKLLKIPSVISVVTSWQESTRQVDYDGKPVPRERFLSWDALREMQSTGLVEIASHTHDLHHGLKANPQGSAQPAATARRFDPMHGYETETQYLKRIEADLRLSRDLIRKRIGTAPRVVTWPYGKYNEMVESAALKYGMNIGLTLDDGDNHAGVPLSRLRRILIESKMNIGDLRYAINIRSHGFTENDRPQKIAHIDLDYIYDPDPEQQRRNINHLVDRLTWLGVNAVYLQAFADPDANGSADAVYFPNRHVPVRADLFSYVAWEIRTRTPARRVYAWMPLLAWELPADHPVAGDKVVTLPGKSSNALNMGYQRLSPFSTAARNVITEIFDDLARTTSFEGVIYHDDITLSDFEDAHPDALATYRSWGLPVSIADIRANDDTLGRWTILKINALDQFATEISSSVRRYKPTLITARNLYAQVAINPRAEVWYAQALENSLAHYDFTAIMAMPYMEQASDPIAFQRQILAGIERFPKARNRIVFELQTVDWRHDQRAIPTDDIVATIGMLYDAGVIHIAYYPDMLFDSHPEPAKMRQIFSRQPNDPPMN
ncbi:MAG: poly-beta-1,6-N-acetyl-D-glucosamine N-deacetylase PgaB [Gammaproteobacteria bacterium]|nr:poly-beta-1,6-N-acetyl-D-glucosamine N-deacetylase PgaB [Gammaproteobacteria bacterium]